MNKITLITFYFGPFPAHFPLYLESCRRNPGITWKIYTDNERDSPWPSNVEHHYMTFEQCRGFFQSKFPFEISLNTPKKLCDFKPAYGYILEAELREYDFWGYCDVDVIWGDLASILKPEILQQYDKLYTLGHLTLYRNNFAVNRCFMQKVCGRVRYMEVYQNPELIGFDEWGNGNVNDIFEKSGFRFLKEAPGADIWPGWTNFSLSWYDKGKRKYVYEKNGNCIFKIEDGKLLLYHTGNKDEKGTEVPYVHMQKRDFSIEIDMEKTKSHYILPGSFLPAEVSLDEALRLGSRRHLIDRQFLKIKASNIWKRIRTRNFRFMHK